MLEKMATATGEATALTLAPSRLLGTRLDLLRDDSWCVTYGLSEICSVPGCWQRPEPGSHHIEPRSRTGGPVDYVVIDNLVVYNRCRLCPMHHLWVTGDLGGHKARIVWEDGAWHWQEPSARVGVVAWVDKGPLKEETWTDTA
jgi:hypothetical protein